MGGFRYTKYTFSVFGYSYIRQLVLHCLRHKKGAFWAPFVDSLVNQTLLTTASLAGIRVIE